MGARTVVIVGGGVIGLSTAYQLALRRYGRIVILEKGRLGGGSSCRAAGITSGLLWSETGVRARKVGLQLFRELGRTLPGYTYHDEHGCLNLFSPELWPAREKLLPLYDRLGAPYRILSAAEMGRRWPALRPPGDFIGLHDPAGGFSEPPEYLSALARAAAGLGVEIHEREKAVEWVLESGRLIGVRTLLGMFRADAVVATVHAWTLPALAPLAVRPPVKHFVHQRYLSAPVSARLDFPPVNADPFGGYVRPAAGNRLLLGVETPEREDWKVDSTDFEMSGLKAPPGLRDRTVKEFRAFLPALADATWESEQVGLISFSMDGEPVLGPVAAVPGLFLGHAFHSGGFAYNPVAGLLLAEWVSEGRTSIDVSAFSPDRFAAAEAEKHLATTIPQKDAFRRRH